LNGRAQLNAAIFYIDWQDIQFDIWLQCGMNFVIGEAEAQIKGFELEGVYMLTDQLTLTAAVGYNDAEYTKTVYGGPLALVPLISEGNSIPGTPLAVNLSGQYDFLVLDTESYVRFDYEYHGEGPDDTPTLDLANRSPTRPPADPRLMVPRPETHMLSLRAGAQIGNLDISVFIKNLLNDNPNLNINDESNNPVPYGPDPHCYSGITLTPRTIGMTISYRY
jgi:outer membrane receptor protein involved in Fe transport